MNIKRLRTSVAAAMGGAVLLAGLLVGASFAMAQETEEPQVTVDGDTLEQGFHGFRDRAHKIGGNLEGIAEELGTTLAELRAQLADGATLEDIAADAGIDLAEVWASLQEEALEAIDDKVAEGDLTQEQADSIKERLESFDPAHGFRGGPRGSFMDRMPGFGGFGGFLGDLDLDLDELKGLLESGSSLDEALDSLGLDLEELAADAQAQAFEHLDEMVAEGNMTQEQADSIKERITSIDLSDGLPFGIGGFRIDGFGGHRDGFMDRMPGFGGFGDFGGFLGDLDLDLDELKGLLESGSSLDEALDSLGLDLEELAADAQAQAFEHLDEMVAEGNMTQEQADSIKERISSIDLSDGLPFGIGGFRMDGPRGDRGHGFGDFGGFFGSDGNAESASLDA